MVNLLSPFFLISSIFTLSLGIWIVHRNPKNKIYLSWFLFCLSVALWSFGLGILTMVKDKEIATFFYFVHYFGAIQIPIAFLFFIRVYFLRDTKIDMFLSVGFLLAVLQMVLFCLGLLVSSLTPKWKFTFYTNPGKFYSLFVAYFFIFVLYSFYLMVKTTFSDKTNRRRKLFFIIATGLGYIGGCSAFLLVYDISLPPYGIFLFLLFPIITTYTIIRYQFLDIEVIIKKTLVFAGLFAAIVGTVSTVVYILNTFVAVYIGLNERVSTAIAIMIAMLLYDPVKTFLVQVTDRYLFQKKEDFRKILNRLSGQIITILDLEKVAKTMLSTLQESIRLESGALLIKNDSGNAYQLLESFGFKPEQDEFPVASGLIQFLSTQERPVNLEGGEAQSVIPQEALTELQKMGAHIALPLFIHNDLIGVLVLGKKKSDEEYKQDEIGYFPTLAGQAAIALSNARLYDILKKSEVDFAQQAKMAAIGTLSAGIGHEVKNPLAAIKMGVEMIKFNKKLGVYKDMDKLQYEAVVDEVIGRVLHNVERAAGVIDRLSSFAKKPKEIRIEPVSVDECVTAALNLVKQELDHYNILVKKEIPADLPLVMADKVQMEEIFVNLIVNARHAVKEKGRIGILATSRDGQVTVSVSDTGAGIPKENLDKIFDPFFTTKDVSRNPDKDAIKGTGLGLFLVREFIKKFGGSVSVESELGRGTTFHIVLKTVQHNAGIV